MTALEMLRAEFESLSALCWEASGIALRDNLSERIEESVTKVDAALKAVEDEQRWIPVEERLPEEDEYALILRFDGNIYCADYDSDEKIWDGPSVPEGGVTHWRPLPEHPRKKEVQE